MDAKPRAGNAREQRSQRQPPHHLIPCRPALPQGCEIKPVQHRSTPVPGPLMARRPLQHLPGSRRDVEVGVLEVIESHSIERTEGVEALMDNPLVVLQWAIHALRARAAKALSHDSSGVERK